MSNPQDIMQQNKEVNAQTPETESVQISVQDLLQNEIQDLEDRLEYVKKLDETKQRIGKEMQKFGNLSADNQRKQKVAQLKQTRLMRIITALKQLSAFLKRQLSPTSSKEDHGGIKGLYIIYLMVGSIVVSVVSFLLRQQSEFILLGFIFIIWYIFLFVTFNFVHEDSKGVVGLYFTSKEPQDIEFEDIITRFRNTNEDSFLVNSAWIDALDKEQVRITESIDNVLLNKTINEIEEMIALKRSQLSQLQNPPSAPPSKPPTSQVDDRQQRELDLQKLEADLDVSL